jgi:hypothetical protein
MIPNNERGPGERLDALLDGLRFVYASTFFRNAKTTRQAAGHSTREEKMAVIVQEVVGSPYGPRFYPHFAGVLRSYNFYAIGLARPEEGLVNLALGLGRTIVDDGIAWSYSPAHPHVNPPYNSAADLVEQTQKEFWAIPMTGAGRPAPFGRTDTLVRCVLRDAERDGTLRHVASTYDVQDDRIIPGVDREGPRIVDFAPILKHELIPLNPLLPVLLEACEGVRGGMVEAEFAVTIGDSPSAPARLGFLQLRPMTISQDIVDVSLEDLSKDNVLLASESVLGNGVTETLRDVVYVKPHRFQPRDAQTIARELEGLNRELIALGHPYILIGFGRWGTTDPQCGIPVQFAQVCGAKVLVEATLPDMNVMLSQGAHFFHNLIAFRAVYFSVAHGGPYRVDWDWLGRQSSARETRFLRHVKVPSPLTVKVDGRASRGVIYHEP